MQMTGKDLLLGLLSSLSRVDFEARQVNVSTQVVSLPDGILNVTQGAPNFSQL